MQHAACRSPACFGGRAKVNGSSVDRRWAQEIRRMTAMGLLQKAQCRICSGAETARTQQTLRSSLFARPYYIIYAAMTWTCAIMQSYYCTAVGQGPPKSQGPSARLTPSCLHLIRWIRFRLVCSLAHWTLGNNGRRAMGDGRWKKAWWAKRSKRPGASWNYWNASKNLLSKSDTTRSGSRCPSQIGGVAFKDRVSHVDATSFPGVRTWGAGVGGASGFF